MSRLFKKNNSVSKVVALWLVFIMMATPFFAHAGIDGDSKAEEPEEPVAEVELGTTHVNNTNFVVSDGNVNFDLDSVGVGKKYYFGVNKFTFSGGDFIFYQNSDPKDVVETLKYTDANTSNIYTINGYELKLGVFETEAERLDIITDENVLKDIAIATAELDDFIGVYAKPIVVDSNNQRVNSQYTLISTIEFEEKNPFDGMGAQLNETAVMGDAIDANKWYVDTEIEITTSTDFLGNYSNNKCAGTIKYGFVTKDGAKSNITWIDSVPEDFGSGGITDMKQTVTFPDNTEGTFDVYLGYFAGEQQITEAYIGTVNVDNVAPVIDENKTGLYYSTDWSTFDINTATPVSGTATFRNTNDKQHYRYYVKVNQASGIKVTDSDVSLLEDGTKQTFAFTSSGVDGVFYGQASDYTGNVTISVDDGLNTPSTSGTLANLVQLDSTHEVYTYEWDVATATSPGTTLPDSATETLIGEQYKLTINAETYDKIARVNIVDENGNLRWYIENGDQQVNPSAYYEFSGTFNIPSDAGVNFTDELYINVIADDGSSTIMEEVALGTIKYDNTDPLVLTENGTANLPLVLPGENQWYGSSATADLKFTVVSGDQEDKYESEISSVKYSINGSGNTLTAVNGVYTIPLNALESQNQSGTKVLITATDEANNTYTNMYTYYYDATAPVFDGTKPIYAMQNGSECSGDIYVNASTAATTAIYTEFSDAVGVKNIKYKLSKWNGTAYVEPTEWSLAIPLYTNKHYFGINQLISTLDGTTDGKYKLEIQLVDIAGNESANTQSIEFTVDCTNPEIESIELQKSADGSIWTTVSEDECFTVSGGTNAGKNAIFIAKDTQYRYMITYSDTNVSDNLLVNDITLNKELVTYSGDSIAVTNGVVYLEIIEKNISADEPEMITALLRDKAGNFVKMDTAPLLQSLDDKVRVTAYLLNENNEVVDELTPEAVSAIIAGKSEYKVRVDYYSTTPIDITVGAEPKMVYTMNGTESEVLYTDGTLQKSNEFNDVDKKYHFVVDYTLPKDVNMLFTNIKVSATNTNNQDSNTPHTLEVSLTDVLFDKSAPVIHKENSTESFADNGAGVWCTSVDANYVVKSGTEDYESKLESVKVSIGGSDFVEMITDEYDGTVDGVINPVESYEGSIKLDASSATASGTEVKIIATDVAGNSETYYYTYYVDKTPPTPTLTVNDKQSFADDITGMPTIKATAIDTLTLKSATIYVEAPNGTTYFKEYHKVATAGDNITKTATYTLADIIGAENVTDGAYSVWMNATDNVDNSLNSATVSFTLDNTLPTVTAKITSGTVSSKSSYYYNTDVTVTFTKSDKNMEFITVKDGDKTVDVKWSDTPDANGVYTGTATFTAEGAHSVTISAQDNAGNSAVPDTESFLIDKTNPVVSTTLGGVVYNDDSGFKYYTSNVTLGASVTDTNEDKKDLNYQIIQAKPDQEATTSSYIETSARSFEYTEEADYTINLFAVDLADNTSATRTVKFRVDKNAPKLTIGGVGSGASSSATTVSFTMEEAFWKDASGTVTIYRKPGEGQAETLLKTIDVTPTAYSTVVRETLSETGIYRIEFTATDRAGHSSATNTTFTIDKDAPVITLTSAENYDVTDESVATTIEISDDFYISKKITLTGTRTDIDGKVSDIDFGDYNPSANPTIIYQNFEEDGIYDIEVTVTDVAGNSDTKSVHFTIDKTDPIINDLPDLDGKILTSFSWEEDLDELVSDLTVCDVHMYLNGSEYDGESAIEDGSYTLLITAEDELGHSVEKSVSFVLDTKEPVFIVTGVEDGEVKNEEYTIDISLQLEEDTLTSVKLNGEDVLVSNNTCTISVTEKGDYVLEMTAIDEAGNESSMKLEFKYGEESQWWLWLIIAIAAVLVLGGIFFIIWKKKRDK